MCNFCGWRGQGRVQPQEQPGKNKRHTPKTKTRKTKKASPVSPKQNQVAVSSQIPSTSPSDADVIADLPSTSVRTIKIPGSSLEPVEDSNIFKWKQFKEKVESSMKRMKKKLTQIGNGKKTKRRSRSPNKVPVEEDSKSDKTDDDDDDDCYDNRCQDHRSPRRSGYHQHRSRSPHQRRSRSPHQSPKARAKRKTAEAVDNRGEGEDGRRNKVRTPTTKSPSRHSRKKTPVSPLRKTPSIDERKIKSAPVAQMSKFLPSLNLPNSATSPASKGTSNDQTDHPPVQQFTSLNTDSSKSNSSQTDWEGKYYSKVASDKSLSLD